MWGGSWFWSRCGARGSDIAVAGAVVLGLPEVNSPSMHTTSTISTDGAKAVPVRQAVASVHLEAHADELYEAVVSRDAQARGGFVVGVTTTGIFCAPGCPARAPKREHCEFFAGPEAALQAGYRPCLRCRPMDDRTSVDDPAWARAIVEHLTTTPEEPITARMLRTMGTDPDRASRHFRARVGSSVQALSRAARVGLAVAWLRRGSSVAGAMAKAGYSSESGFRKAVAELLGTTPGEAAKSASAPMLSAAWMKTPLGPMLACAGERGVCLLEFVDRRGLATSLSTLRQRTGLAIVPAPHEHLDAAGAWLERYFRSPARAGELAIEAPGSPMQEAVWAELREIPLGETRTYLDVAKRVGRPKAVRAIAGAIGDNRIALAIPCHRVVGSDGDLTGYAGGVERKRWLLNHERAGAGDVQTMLFAKRPGTEHA